MFDRKFTNWNLCITRFLRPRSYMWIFIAPQPADKPVSFYCFVSVSESAPTTILRSRSVGRNSDRCLGRQHTACRRQPTFPCKPGKTTWDSVECGRVNPNNCFSKNCGNRTTPLQIKGNVPNKLGHSPDHKYIYIYIYMIDHRGTA